MRAPIFVICLRKRLNYCTLSSQYRYLISVFFKTKFEGDDYCLSVQAFSNGVRDFSLLDRQDGIWKRRDMAKNLDPVWSSNFYLVSRIRIRPFETSKNRKFENNVVNNPLGVHCSLVDLYVKNYQSRTDLWFEKISQSQFVDVLNGTVQSSLSVSVSVLIWNAGSDSETLVKRKNSFLVVSVLLVFSASVSALT